MSIPDTAKIQSLLDQLEHGIADDLESAFLDFKPWQGPKDDLKLACEYAVCFANGAGGVVVFGVADKIRGRAQAIHGTKGYDLDKFRYGIFDGTKPNIEAEVEEIDVPEGTGKLLLVRVREGTQKPYGTAAGLFKQRIGKNCMPLDPLAFQRARISTGAVDWSGEPANGVGLKDLDPLQVERARRVLRSKAPSPALRRKISCVTRPLRGTVRWPMHWSRYGWWSLPGSGASEFSGQRWCMGNGARSIRATGTR